MLPSAGANSASLKLTFQGNFSIGCALSGSLPSSLSTLEAELLARHFNAITPENCMKPSLLHPEPARYDFGESDALVSFAERQQMAVNGHCLVWHQQTPDWLFDTTGHPAARERTLEHMREHIRAVAGRYRGRIQSWDVVNEAVADVGPWLRETSWLQFAGQDYLLEAFRCAAETDPNAKLYYNDFSIEEPAKRARTLRLLRWLLEQGAKVDGVGIQGHWVLDRIGFDDIEASIEAYHALGLQVAFTEVDLDVIERPDCGADISAHRDYELARDPFPNRCPDEILERQAAQYSRLFEIFLAHSSAIDRVTFWGLHDGRSWLNYWPGKRTNHPLLFDRECNHKPGFERIVRGAARR